MKHATTTAHTHRENVQYQGIQITKNLQAKHTTQSDRSSVGFFGCSDAAQRIFNLQIMSWFIAKNVSESWNVNWNLMLSRLKGNSQIYANTQAVWYTYISAPVERCSFFSMFIFVYTPRVFMCSHQSKNYGLSGWMGSFACSFVRSFVEARVLRWNCLVLAGKHVLHTFLTVKLSWIYTIAASNSCAQTKDLLHRPFFCCCSSTNCSITSILCWRMNIECFFVDPDSFLPYEIWRWYSWCITF